MPDMPRPRRPARSHTELHDELHARPALPVHSPGLVSYWTQAQRDAALAVLALLRERTGAAAPPAGARHHVLRAPGFDLKFERHGEFVSWLVSCPLGADRAPADASALDALPPDFHALLAGTPMLGAAHVLRLRAPPATLDACRALLGGGSGRGPLLGARIADGDATVLTDLALRADGYVRFVVLDTGQSAEQAARTAQRLADLREQRVEGLQTLAGFFARRFAPAMALCASTDARLTDIAERIHRAVDLARVRVEVQREASNQALFKALARRQKLQLRLQQTVEGLSVVAISYYALGLVNYAAKALKDGLPLTPDAITGLAVLPVLAAVALFVRRLRRHFEQDD